MAYCEIQECDLAIADFTKTIELNPTFNGYSGRGLAYACKSNFDDAIAIYNIALSMIAKDKDDLRFFGPTIYRRRAFVYEKIGRNDLAESDRQKATELESQRKK